MGDPWLANFLLDDEVVSLFSLSKGKYEKYTIPGTHNKLILACSWGWLILKDAHDCSYSLLNPISMEKIELPFLLEFEFQVYPEDPDSENFCLLTASPKHPNCFILFVDNEYRVARFSRLANAKLITQFSIPSLSCPTIFQEKLCFKSTRPYDPLDFEDQEPYSGRYKDLLAMDFKDEELKFMPIASFDTHLKRIYPGTFCSFFWFIGHGDDLYFVDQNNFESSQKEVCGFTVYQLDVATKTWVELKNIGDRAFFLSGCLSKGMCCSLEESSGVKQNAIYFLQEDDNFVHVFNLKNNSFSLVSPFPASMSHKDMLLDWV